jgi:hypothetical protein
MHKQISASRQKSHIGLFMARGPANPGCRSSGRGRLAKPALRYQCREPLPQELRFRWRGRPGAQVPDGHPDHELERIKGLAAASPTADSTRRGRSSWSEAAVGSWTWPPVSNIVTKDYAIDAEYGRIARRPVLACRAMRNAASARSRVWRFRSARSSMAIITRRCPAIRPSAPCSRMPERRARRARASANRWTETLPCVP